MPDEADVAAQWQQEEGGSSRILRDEEGDCGIVNHQIRITLFIKSF